MAIPVLRLEARCPNCTLQQHPATPTAGLWTQRRGGLRDIAHFQSGGLPFLHGGLKGSLGHLCMVRSSSNARQPRPKSETAKPKRPSKNDLELVKELQQFFLATGLPPDKVPSTKELAIRGRQDLANVVRRRGYKAIGQLLGNHSVETNGGGAGGKETNGGGAGGKESPEPLRALKDPDNKSSSLCLPAQEQPTFNGVAKPDSKIAAADTECSADDGIPLSKIQSALAIQAEQGAFHDILNDVERKVEHTSGETDVQRSLHERAAEFVRTGRLDFGQSIVDNAEVEEEEEDEGEENYEDSSDDDNKLWEAQHSDKLNAGAIAMRKAARLRATLLPFLRSSTADRQKPGQNNESLLTIMGKQNEINKLHKWQDFSIQSAQGTETQRELDHIKSALQSRELELTEMSRELEEAKAQLALVRAKTTAELAQAKQLALEKDIRLSSVNRAITGLKQVQIEYWGEGGCVELAGSFNGWQHFITMQPDPTSEIPKPDCSRGPVMWGTEIWLYPGIYEIKFIVDGNWQVDHRRDMVMRNSHQNNIIRVDP